MKNCLLKSILTKLYFDLSNPVIVEKSQFVGDIAQMGLFSNSKDTIQCKMWMNVSLELLDALIPSELRNILLNYCFLCNQTS